MTNVSRETIPRKTNRMVFNALGGVFGVEMLGRAMRYAAKKGANRMTFGAKLQPE